MASRWLAIISACQTSPIAMMLIATTQTAMTRVFCVSETGIRIERAIQDIVRGLLVLGRYAVGPTRDLPADATRVAPRMLATQGPVRYASKSVHRLRKFAASSAWTRLSEFGFGTCLVKKGRWRDTFFPPELRIFRSLSPQSSPTYPPSRGLSLEIGPGDALF